MRESGRLRVLLVDDEVGGLTSLRTALEPLADVEIVGECTSVDSAADSLRRLAPDLVFLDVRLGNQTGFQLSDQFDAGEVPPIVFVTAYAEHAVEAFDLNAVDYVLKPFAPARIARAVRRARKRVAPNASQNVTPERIMVRQGDSIRFVRVERVIRLEAAGNYVRLISDDGNFLLRSTLRDLLDRLDASTFVRTHRSHAVNLDRVSTIHSWFSGDYMILMDNEEQVRLSRGYRDDVLKAVH